MDTTTNQSHDQSVKQMLWATAALIVVAAIALWFLAS